MSAIYTLGIDVGSTASKCIMLKDGQEIVAKSLIDVGAGTSGPQRAIDAVLENAGMKKEDVAFTLATGYGRNSLMNFADKQMSELSCHARGAYFLFPDVHTVIDIGGQDVKVLHIDNGAMTNFQMNDKCAAGTGRFLQVLSGILGMELAELGEAAGRGKPAAISSMCAVFAETEIIGLLARGTPPADIAAGVFRSIARRMRGLAARIPLHGECTFTGGLATSPSFSRLLSEELGVPVNVPEYPQLVGAIGAALIAARI